MDRDQLVYKAKLAEQVRDTTSNSNIIQPSYPNIIQL